MDAAPPPPEGEQETFLSHLIELRSRLMKSIIAVAISMFAADCISSIGFFSFSINSAANRSTTISARRWNAPRR